MSQIILTTFNAKYAHAAFGLRYLMANLGELTDRAAIVEFDIAARTTDVIETILARDPQIVGLGVYIWNVTQSTQFVAELKRVRPDITVVLGGPEVSYETEQQAICSLADYVITGEADLAFAALCRQLLAGDRPSEKIIAATLPEFGKDSAVSSLALLSAAPTMALPYHFYTDEDLKHRVIYVEASRGCPFKCEFCLSSLEVPVRNVPLQPFLDEMQKLLDRGCRQFKFVDRTFNLNLNFSRSILQFFFDQYTPGLFLHFEMIPDRLPEALRELIAKFPPGVLQFEVGVQSLNADVQHRISRRQDNGKLAENLRFLRDHTGVHVHADLIVGLPGEDTASFGRGFDELLSLRPQEIQVGILKRLRGTPIVRHDSEWAMVYSPEPPYEVLRTSVMSFVELQRLRRFSRYWDLIANSGNFAMTLPLVWGMKESPSRKPIDAHPHPSLLPAGEGTGKSPADQRHAQTTGTAPSLPSGESRSEGDRQATPFNAHPHPSLLPEGEGTGEAPADQRHAQTAGTAPSLPPGESRREGDRQATPFNAHPHPSLLPEGEMAGAASPFKAFLALSDWLFDQTGRRHGISLTNLSELLFRFLTEVRRVPKPDAATAIWADYQRVGRSDRPAFLKDLVAPADTRKLPSRTSPASRQARHLAK